MQRVEQNYKVLFKLNPRLWCKDVAMAMGWGILVGCYIAIVLLHIQNRQQQGFDVYTKLFPHTFCRR